MNINKLNDILSSRINPEKTGLDSEDYYSERYKKFIKFMTFIGNPQCNYKTIHIVGSKGKSSTAFLLSTFIKSAKLRVGTFTSPHIMNVRERILLNNNVISEKDFCSIAELLQNYEREIGYLLSYFEFITAASFIYFKNQNVDYAIIEAGLGGRLDATNCLKPHLVLITQIEREHTNILGKTISSITSEKAAVIKKGTIVITNNTSPEVLKIIKSNCVKNNSKYINLKNPGKYEIKKNNIKFIYDNQIIHLPKKYIIHCKKNLPLCLEAIKYILKNTEVFPAQFSASTPVIPGRFQIIKKKPIIIMDNAHTASSTDLLIDSIKQVYSSIKFNILFSSLKNKNLKAVLKILSQINNKIYLFEIKNNPRAEKIEKLRSIAKFYFKKVIILQELKKSNKIFESNLLITGSTYLVNEVLKTL